MKRTCCSHKQAQFLCVTEHCQQKCAYVCSIPYDQCKDQHESCHLVSINYITKKCNKILLKQKSLNMKLLQKIYDQSKKIIARFQNLFQQRQNALQVKDILDPHGLFNQDQKKKLIAFVKKDDKKNSLDFGQDDSLHSLWIQKELMNLNYEIGIYLKSTKDELMNLEQQQSVIEGRISSKPQSRIISSSIKKNETQKGSVMDKIRSQSKGQTVNLAPNGQIQISPTKILKIKKIQTPAISATNGLQVKISAIIKGHNPIGPLYSRITNNAETLQTFFYQKFKGANLLYRASENDYLASKFHEKCDGFKNTLTILITEYDKIIGGFTPLSWKSSGDWYDDETESSFIFSLTEGERFPIMGKAKAIWCNHSYGPSFGYPDLEIANKSFYNQNSCANFPQFYNNGNYTQSPASIQVFCGTKSGHFRIKQWQVYQLQF